MRILHILPSLSPKQGGPTQAALNFTYHLRQHGIDAEIATTNDDGSNFLDVALHQRIEYQQVPVWFFPRMARIKAFMPSFGLTQWLWQHIADYDLIHTHYLFSYAPTVATAIARRRNIPYIVRTIGQLHPWALNQSRLKKQIYTSIIERHNLNRAAAIHCTSAGEAEDVRNFGIQQTSTITLPLGVNQPANISQAKQKLRQIYNISAQTPIVLFLSRLHYKKRPDLLIQALNKLATQDFDFHLILAGSGESDYENQLKNLVASNGLAKRTTFTGFVTGTDKELILQGSDIFVLPSFSENFGIAIVEAMAAGLPVIITPGVQIAPEIDQAKAGLVVEGELDALTNAIAQLLTSPNLRYQLSENGKKLVNSRYCWSAIAQNLASVYQAIIEGKNFPEYRGASADKSLISS